MTDPASVRSGSDPAKSDPGGALRELWDAHAKEWIAWVRASGQPDSYWRFHRERFLALVPSAGQLTVDIGCGEGRVGRDLQERGHRVLGVDWSETMCRAALGRPGPGQSGVVAADAVKLPLADASADCAIAFMCLQDIDEMPKAVEEISRVLKDGRKLAMAIVHPVYSGGGFAEAGAGLDDNFIFKRSYFDHEFCTSIDRKNDLTVTFHRKHRPLEAYVHALIENGFSIEQLHEVTDKDKDKPWHRVPMFLDILATRQERKEVTDSASQTELNCAASAGARRRGLHIRRNGASTLESRRPEGSPAQHVRPRRRALRHRTIASLQLQQSATLLSGLAIMALAMVWYAISRLG